MNLRILVAGASGTIGLSLVPYLRAKGHEVVVLKRTAPVERNEIFWDPETAFVPNLEWFDVIINLAGYPLMKKRWNHQVREKIRNSRLVATRLLVEAIHKLAKPPKVFISASATGYYGDCGEEAVTEEHLPGSGFLATLCRDWEEEALKASSSNTRVIVLRIGLVLSSKGGALASMLPLFKLGLGGKLGSGKQYMSWIAIDDLLALIDFIMRSEQLSGPVNATAPSPVTNEVFTAAIAKAVRRPAWFSVPAWALRLALGGIADEGVLLSAKVYPQKAIAAGFSFLYRDLSQIQFE